MSVEVKKSKKQTKFIIKKEIIKKVKNKDRKVKLKKEQSLEVELKLEQRRNFILKLQRKEEAIKTAQLEYKLEELKLKEMRGEINRLIISFEQEKEVVKTFNDRYKGYITELSKELKLDTTKWGFHPDTGEIVPTK